MGIALRGCAEERVFPGGVTGDRFSRRENLMEKSEVSDTDAPAIRQAIHSSSFRAFLFAAWRGEAREGESQAGREMHAGSNIRLLANNRCRAYATRMSFCGGFQESDMLSRRGGSAEPKYSAHCVHAVRMSRATRRANSR